MSARTRGVAEHHSILSIRPTLGDRQMLCWYGTTVKG